jgi:hypothetical protein
MAATLSSLIEDPALCDRIGKNAEARVRSKFQWNGYALQSCLAAYRQVCSEHRSVPLVAA